MYVELPSERAKQTLRLGYTNNLQDLFTQTPCCFQTERRIKCDQYYFNRFDHFRSAFQY